MQMIKAMQLCIVYAILFVDTVDMKIKACNALNAMFVDTVDTTVKTHPQIPAHNFLNIQLIFNLKKALESWDWGLFNYTIKYYICWHCYLGLIRHFRRLTSIRSADVHFVWERCRCNLL